MSYAADVQSRAGKWSAFCRALNLNAFINDYGGETIEEILRFLFVLAENEYESDPKTRTMSLEKDLDLVWHELITDEYIYKALMDKLMELHGRRPWHTRAPLAPEELARRVTKWKAHSEDWHLLTVLGLGKRARVPSPQPEEGDEQEAEPPNERIRVIDLNAVITNVDGFERGSTILDLKRKITDLTGLPVDHQRLLARGRQFNDDELVPDYAFGGTTLIHLVMRMSGC